MSMMSKILGATAALALSAGAALAEPALIFDLGGKFDKSFNEAAFNGATRWAEDTGGSFREIELQSEAQREQALRRFAEAGANPIVMAGFAFATALDSVAADYPDIAFLMGSSFAPQAPNFSVFDNFIHEPAYLSGMIAGAASENNVIGMIGGYAIPEVNRLMNAFMEGAKETNSDVSFLVNFIDSWYDPAKAKESSFAMMDAGADVMYAERFGVSDAAVERGMKAIGNVIDTSADYPNTILASAIWHMEATVDTAIKGVSSGTYVADDYGQYSFMAHGGGSLVLDEALVPADIVSLVKAKEAAIMDGSYTVVINDDAPVSGK